MSKPVWFVLSAGPIVSALVGMASGGTESPWTRLEEALILESKYQPSLQLPITTEVRSAPACPLSVETSPRSSLSKWVSPSGSPERGQRSVGDGVDPGQWCLLFCAAKFRYCCSSFELQSVFLSDALLHDACIWPS